MASKTRKKAPPSLSKLKRDLDHHFSLKVREGANKCYTCDKVSPTLQCGHFVPRQYLATRWDESNARPQCVGCNIWGKGMILEFEERLTKEIGAAKVQALKDKRKELWKLDRAWYTERIAYFKAQTTIPTS